MIRIAVNGIDERTDINALKEIYQQYGNAVEFGILYVQYPKGRNRHPSFDWAVDVVNQLDNCALHVCGMKAREQLLNGELKDITSRVKRVQVNGQLTEEEAVRCSSQNYVMITQHNVNNLHLVNADIQNHVLLIDASGGYGILPDSWSRPETEKSVGFAGGLGPHNLADQWKLIEPIAKGDWWVDMETSMRTEYDWFSIEKAKQVIEIFHRLAK